MPSFYNIQRRRQTTGRKFRPRYTRPGPAYFERIARMLAAESEIAAEIAAVIAALNATFMQPVYGKYQNWSKSQLERKLTRLKRARDEL